MLTQRVPQLHCDYLQPSHISTSSDSKTSPLALLAATCSSIGRNDNDKPKESTVKSMSPLTMKMSPKDEDQVKSSFKPYKTDMKPSVIRSSPSSIPPRKTSPNCSRMNPPPMFLGRIPPPTLPPPNESDKMRNCGNMFLEVNRESGAVHPVMKCHSSPIPPFPPGKPPASLHGCHDHDCTHCAPMLPRPHGEPIPPPPRSSSTVGCPCAMCQGRPSGDPTKCHYPPSNLTAPHTPFKSVPPPPITCRDPNCTNCPKTHHSSLQNFLHPALIHQCTHGPSSYPSLPPPPHGSLEYQKNSVNSKAFVCNWVSDGKHCGKYFPSSEELFQHLKTHTSAQQQNQNCDAHSPPSALPPPPPQPGSNTCNIHGCPCRNGTSKTPTTRPTLPGFQYGSGIRYSPYARTVATVPGGTTGYQGHSYVPHGVFHY